MKIEGSWYIPGSENKMISGILEIIDNEKKLELYGHFNFDDIDQTNWNTPCEIVYGKTIDGKLITIYGLVPLNVKYNSTSTKYVKSVWTVSLMIEGKHVNKENFESNSFRVNYSLMNSFINMNGYELSYYKNSYLGEIKYKPVPSIVYDLGNMKIKIVFEFKFPTIKNPLNEIKISQNILIQFEYVERKTLFQALSDIQHLRDLLTVLTSKEIIIKDTEIEYYNEMIKMNSFYKYHINYNQSQDYLDDLHPSYLRLNYHKLKDDFQNILKKWFNNKEKLSHSISYFIGGFYYSKYINQKLLFMIFALENYHREYYPISNDQKSNAKKIKKEILESCPDEYKKWLNEKLAFSHEPSLKDRINEIYNKNKHIKYFENINEADDLIKKIVNTRNMQAHGNNRKKTLNQDNYNLAIDFLYNLFIYEVGNNILEIKD